MTLELDRSSAQLHPASEAVAALDDAAREHVAADRPANTEKTYRSDWRAWCRFAAEFGIAEEAASVGTLVAFIEWMQRRGYAYKTASQRVSGTRIELRRRGIELSDADSNVVTNALLNYKRAVAESGQKRGRGKAPALLVRHLRAICHELPDTVAGRRDRALLLIGFGIGARRSELASLLLDDVEPCPEGLCVTVRWSKTGRPREVAVGWGTHEPTCPVRAWQAWTAASGLAELTETEGVPAFQQVTRHDTLVGQALSAKGVGRIMSRLANRAGIPGPITGHSLRVGMATEARRAGHDDKTIAEQGGWVPGSTSLHGYLRTVDRWAENALVGIGL